MIGIIKVKFLRLNEDAILPTLGTPFSACYDLYSIEDAIIKPKESFIFSLGFSMQILDQPNVNAILFSRSSYIFKYNVSIISPGIVDNDFRGEMKVLLHNRSEQNDFVIRKGEKIAQLGFIEFAKIIFEETKELDDSIRGEKGFGSTGR